MNCWNNKFTVYNSIFNITHENNNFELYTDNFDDFSFDELKDELEEILGLSDITPSHLQQEILGPYNIESYKKLRSEKSSTDDYLYYYWVMLDPQFQILKVI